MLERFSRNDAPQDVIASLQNNGAVIVKDFLSKEMVDRINNDIEPEMSVATHKGFVNEGLASFFKENTRNVHPLPAVSDGFVEDVLVHPLFIEVAEEIFRGNCDTFNLSLASVYDRGPGAEPQYLHRDDTTWPRMAPHPFQYSFAAMIALSEYTFENGATLVVPGSHTWDYEKEHDPADIVAAEMDAGSAVIYLGSTLHCAGRNITTDRWRRGMHVSYALGWLRTCENLYLQLDLDRVRKMSPQAQALLGYTVHDRLAQAGGYLGAVAMRNPMELLASGEL